jgi:hypothetical protein
MGTPHLGAPLVCPPYNRTTLGGLGFGFVGSRDLLEACEEIFGVTSFRTNQAVGLRLSRWPCTRCRRCLCLHYFGKTVYCKESVKRTWEWNEMV